MYQSDNIPGQMTRFLEDVGRQHRQQNDDVKDTKTRPTGSVPVARIRNNHGGHAIQVTDLFAAGSHLVLKPVENPLIESDGKYFEVIDEKTSQDQWKEDVLLNHNEIPVREEVTYGQYPFDLDKLSPLNGLDNKSYFFSQEPVNECPPRLQRRHSKVSAIAMRPRSVEGEVLPQDLPDLNAFFDDDMGVETNVFVDDVKNNKNSPQTNVYMATASPTVHEMVDKIYSQLELEGKKEFMSPEKKTSLKKVCKRLNSMALRNGVDLKKFKPMDRQFYEMNYLSHHPDPLPTNHSFASQAIGDEYPIYY